MDAAVVKEVECMSKISDKNLTAVRIEIAVNICTLRPKVLEAICSQKPTYLKTDDVAGFHIVKIMMKAEPSIGNILKFYHKRLAR